MVTINGEAADAAGRSVCEVLREDGYDSRSVAVEYNGRILSKSEYASTVLQENDAMEIVCFMGGGC